MDVEEVLALTKGLPVGACVQVPDATLIVGPRTVAVVPEDPYKERWEVRRFGQQDCCSVA